MNTELGRVKIIHGTPPVAPGKCVICGTTSGTFIDIGFDIDFYGTVYFCFGVCFREVANALDYYSPEQVEAIKKKYQQLVEINANLYKELEFTRNALDALADLRDFRSGLDAVTVDKLETEPEPSATSPEPIDGIKQDSDSPKSGLVESIDESGSEDVYNDDSLKGIFDEIDI